MSNWAFASSIRDTCEANAGEEPQNVINPELSIDKDLYKSKTPKKKVVKKVKRKGLKRSSSR